MLWNGCNAVSYTHLDVYKRQLIHQISGIIFYNTDTIFLTLILQNLKVVSVYTMYNNIIQMVNTMLVQLVNGFNFRLGQIFNTDKKEYNRLHHIMEVISLGSMFSVDVYKRQILRGIGLNLSLIILGAKLAGVLFYLYIVYRGMKHLKNGKMVVAAASTMPGAMFIIANFNYDYWLIGLTLYSTCYIVGEYQNPDKYIKIKDFVYIIASTSVSYTHLFCTA